MAEIKPFKGYRYNQKKVKMKNVVTPPYDVISQEAQDKYYKADKANIIRLILGKEKKTDNNKNNKYTRAHDTLNSLTKKEILIEDKKECIYMCKQDFNKDGKKISRQGFISLLKIEPLFKGTVYPHERTLSKPKADRLNLMKNCNSNFSQIFALYNDKNSSIDKALNKISKRKPCIDVIGKDKARNRLWKIEDQDLIKLMVKKMKDKKVFIADGHHRYETALEYKKINKNKNAGFVMTFFCNMSHPGLVIYPTHRLVKIKNYKREKFLELLYNYFSIETIKTKKDLFVRLNVEYKKKNIAFGMYADKKLNLLILKNKNLLKDKKKHSKTYKELDVYILENIIFEQALKFSKKDIALQKYIKYVKELEDTFTLVNKKEFNVGFVMNPTRLAQISKVALSGEVMPQKSTYFYPKLLTGLVMNLLD